MERIKTKQKNCHASVPAGSVIFLCGRLGIAQSARRVAQYKGAG